jgi:hypothetical protein
MLLDTKWTHSETGLRGPSAGEIIGMSFVGICKFNGPDDNPRQHMNTARRDKRDPCLTSFLLMAHPDK